MSAAYRTRNRVCSNQRVDLSAQLLALLAPLGIGDELLPGAHLNGVSTELGLRLAFHVDGRIVHVEVSRVEDGRRFAARTPRLHLAYRSSEQTPVKAELGLALCGAVAALAERNEDAVLARIASETAAARVADEGGQRIREVQVERVLELTGEGARRYYSLSPYVGCLIGCRFCYAQSPIATVRKLEQLPDTPWGSYVDVRVNAAEVLARELATLPPAPIKFCPIVADPYQAVEARYQVTRACLTAICQAAPHWPTLVLTRSSLIERDADLLAAIPGARAGVSIPTIDDDVRRHFEPRGAPIADRLGVLRRLRARGVHTCAVVQPMLPGAVGELARALADAAETVSLDVLNSVGAAERDFADPTVGHCREDAWQRARLAELAAALTALGVPLWRDELPPNLPPLAAAPSGATP